MEGGIISTCFSLVKRLLYDIKLLFVPGKIFVSAYAVTSLDGTEHINWGDDINVFFIEYLTGRKVVVKNKSILYRFLPIKSYSCIGSVIGSFNSPKLEVWGSGAISSETRFSVPPKRIHSVRGPLTRDLLLSQGIDCPAKYGDPALLISRFYQPNVIKKYKLGIVLHYTDMDNPIPYQYIKVHPGSTMISMRGYKDWKDVVNEIVSCERIISTSLHGLIVADSYGIPNCYIQLNQLIGGTFKFQDYFKSVGRIFNGPVPVDSSDDIEILADSNRFENCAVIDYDSIIEVCPFKDRISKL